MCVFSAVIKPASGNIISGGGGIEMTEKLGVLLVDVPEPKWWKYYYLENDDGDYNILKTDDKKSVESQSVLCTQEEAKKYPQFRWVAVEELK